MHNVEYSSTGISRADTLLSQTTHATGIGHRTRSKVWQSLGNYVFGVLLIISGASVFIGDYFYKSTQQKLYLVHLCEQKASMSLKRCSVATDEIGLNGDESSLKETKSILELMRNGMCTGSMAMLTGCLIIVSAAHKSQACLLSACILDIFTTVISVHIYLRVNFSRTWANPNELGISNSVILNFPTKKQGVLACGLETSICLAHLAYSLVFLSAKHRCYNCEDRSLTENLDCLPPNSQENEDEDHNEMNLLIKYGLEPGQSHYHGNYETFSSPGITPTTSLPRATSAKEDTTSTHNAVDSNFTWC